MTNENNTAITVIANAPPMPAPRRIHVEFHGFPALRIQPHKTEPHLAVVKSKHPEGIAMLLQSAGVSVPSPIETFKGSKYFISFIDRAYLAVLLPEVLGALCLPPVVESPMADYDDAVEEPVLNDPDPYGDED